MGQGGEGSAGSSHRWLVVVKYRYEVDGESYEGARIQLEEMGHLWESAAKAQAAALAPGTVVPVYHDPADPSRAVLERGGSWVGGVVFLGGLFLVVTTLLDGRKRKQYVDPL